MSLRLRSILTFSLLIIILQSSSGQRFSLLTEGGIMKTQADGDKLHGFNYNGFLLGIGTNYSINQENFLSVKTSYYKQGSRRKDSLETRQMEGIQLELDISSIGLELSYKYKPKNRPYFCGAGIVRHQIIGLNYQVVESILQQGVFTIEPEQLSSSFLSYKLFLGASIKERAGVYIAYESSMTNILKSRFEGIKELTPYAVSIVLTYDIIASQMEDKRSRPGSRSR